MNGNISVGEFIDNYSQIIGYGIDSVCAYELINKARLIAYPLGDWVGTMAYAGISVGDGPFTLPAELELIRGARCYNGTKIQIEQGHVTKEVYCSCDNTPVITKIIGRVNSPFQLTENYPVSFYAINKNDEGKEVRVQYINLKGTRYDETINLLHLTKTSLSNSPFKISRISKPYTIGAVAIVAGPSGSDSVKIDYLLPSDKNPVYTQYCSTVCGCIVVEAKKRFIPYTINDINEEIDIHPSAMSLLIRAAKSQDDGNPNWQKDYSASVSLAVNFLKQQQVDEEGTNEAQLTVQYNDYSFDHLTNLQSI